ncbi:MAG: RDD family protein [Caldilineaceae bacterium]|nr:RDD family protein [Caldilineaceae bacterium]
MESPSDLRPLDGDEYTIATPENVTFDFQIAGIGSRFIGALIDTFLIVLLLFLLNILLGVALSAVSENGGGVTDFADDPGWVTGLVIALYALINFGLFWGYYLVFELGWQGQTPGKRLAGTRVVKLDGSGPGFLEVAIRNLVRLVDFLPVAYALGFVTMFFNRNVRRLGDFAAGTLVIRQPDTVRLDALAQPTLRKATPAADAILPDTRTIRRLSGDDYQLICALLDRQARGRANPALTLRLAHAIAAKLETPLPGPTWRDAHQFLYSVAAAYRQAAGPP